jgi:hypothetical protein
LKKLANSWYLNDNKVYDVLKTFHEELKTKLDDIYYNLDNRKDSKSYNELQLFLKNYIPKFDEIEPKMLEIVKISTQL